MGSKYFKEISRGKDNLQTEFSLELNSDADINEIIDYYYALNDLKEAIEEEEKKTGEKLTAPPLFIINIRYLSRYCALS